MSLNGQLPLENQFIFNLLADSTSVANTTAVLERLRWCDGSSEMSVDGD